MEDVERLKLEHHAFATFTMLVASGLLPSHECREKANHIINSLANPSNKSDGSTNG